MNLEMCFSKSLLVRIPPDRNKAERSLATSSHKLELARKELDAGIHEGAIVSAYASMFHSARALLFRDGIKERSHYAVYIYLREKYNQDLGNALLNEFSALRLQRHEVLYNFSDDMESVSREDAESIVSAAASFLSEISRILEA